jgi:hypothetical protein
MFRPFTRPSSGQYKTLSIEKCTQWDHWDPTLTISCVLDGIVSIHYTATQRDGLCQIYLFYFTFFVEIILGGARLTDTALQAGRSWVRFPMGSLDFSLT